MQVHKGDEVVVKSHRIGQPDRKGEVLEARGPHESEPFLVRWDGGLVTLLFPGTDAEIS